MNDKLNHLKKRKEQTESLLKSKASTSRTIMGRDILRCMIIFSETKDLSDIVVM